MRFVLLVAGATATGALCGGGIQAMFPQTKEMFAAVTALGGNVADFKLGEINPVKAYEDVRRQITSGQAGRIAMPTAPAYNFAPINPDSLRPAFKIDEEQIRRAVAAGINSRVQQDIRRTQDFQAYARNPRAWHGIPPH
jgi:hypothetical protein